MIGVAIGTRFPHPLAGVLGAFVWLLPFSQSNRFNSAIPWLFPWVKPAQLNELPQPPARGIHPRPPTRWSWPRSRRSPGSLRSRSPAGRRHRLGLLVAAAAAIAAIVGAGVVQLQPIPTRDIDRARQPSGQHRRGPALHDSDTNGHHVDVLPLSGVRFAAFEPARPRQRCPLGRYPREPTHALTISQTSGLNVDDPTLTHGHSSEQVTAWRTQLGTAPANLPSSSAIYADLGPGPPSGQQSVARFDLALGAAEWAVGLPTNTGVQHRPAAQPMRTAESGARGDRDLACGTCHPATRRTISGQQRQLLGRPGRWHRRRRLDLPGRDLEQLRIAGAADHGPRLPASPSDDEVANRPCHRRAFTRSGTAGSARTPPTPSWPPRSASRCPRSAWSARAARPSRRCRRRQAHNRMHHVNVAGRRRRFWTHAAPGLARHILVTMPWATLVAGCASGTLVLALMAHFAGHSPLNQDNVRLTFLPAVGALAFVPHVQFRPVIQTAPIPTWIAPAGQVLSRRTRPRADLLGAVSADDQHLPGARREPPARGLPADCPTHRLEPARAVRRCLLRTHPLRSTQRRHRRARHLRRYCRLLLYPSPRPAPSHATR